MPFSDFNIPLSLLHPDITLPLTVSDILLSLADPEAALRPWWPEKGDTRARFGNTLTNVSVTVGGVATLPCVVYNLSDRTVGDG